MGYTHYMTFKKSGKTAQDIEKRYKLACKIINHFVYNVRNGINCDKISLSGYSAHTLFKYGGVNFNGKKEDAHETFFLREHFKGNEEFQFCKTNRKPYDIVVCGCLGILKGIMRQNVRISSDGDLNDHIEGLKLVEKVLGVKLRQKILKDKRWLLELV